MFLKRVSGNESARAIETAPRSPANAMTLVHECGMVSIAFGLLVSLLVLAVTLLFESRDFPGVFMFAFLAFPGAAVCPAAILLYSWTRYRRAIVKLDQYIGKLDNGESVPSLKELFS